MTSIFHTYKIIAESGLFDPIYYTDNHPNSLSGIDPLLHYIEIGAAEGRDPSPTFDTTHYLAECAILGITPEVPLLHYIEEGRALGLIPRRPEATDAPSSIIAAPPRDTTSYSFAVNEIRTWIDLPATIDDVATTPISGALSIHGWSLAYNGVASVDIRINDSPMGSAHYGIRRDDVADAFPGHPGALLSGFAVSIPARDLAPGRARVAVYVTDKAANTSPPVQFTVEIADAVDSPEVGDFRYKITRRDLRFYNHIIQKNGQYPRFSMLMVIQGPIDILSLSTTLESLLQQQYDRWNLLIILKNKRDAKRLDNILMSDFGELAQHLTVLVGAQVTQNPKNKSADFYGLLRAGDKLSAHAFWEFSAWCACNPNSDFLYCDERRVDPSTGRKTTFFKPDWSPDLLLSTNYIGRLWLASSRLLRKVGWNLTDLAVRSNYEIILVLTGAARKVDHLPIVLIDQKSDADPPDIDKAALNSILDRRGISAIIVDGPVSGTFQIRRKVTTNSLVSIIILTCAAQDHIKSCVDSIKSRTAYRYFEIICVENIPDERIQWRDWLFRNVDKVISLKEPFNWSRYNNIGAGKANGDFLIFLNDDVEVISPNWIGTLLSFAERDDVGAVGPLLLYPDGTIQHAGVFLTQDNIARHAFRYNAESSPGYFGLALTDRNVIGVTGACLMTRKAVFERVGKFDEHHSVINNDLDYCLKTVEAGLLNVYTAQAKLVHYELASRGKLPEEYDRNLFEGRWEEFFLRGDPYFHSRFSKKHDDFTIDNEPFRIVHPGGPVFSVTDIRRILVIKLDHIGDAATAIPAIRRLRGLFPNAHLCVLASQATSSIWSLVSGIDEVLEFEFFHARSGLGPLRLLNTDLDNLKKRLEAYRFDLAVDLRKSPETRHILRLSNARYLAGFSYASDFPWLDVSVEWERDQKFCGKHSHVSDDLLCLIHAIEIACQERQSIELARQQTDQWPQFLPDSFRRGRLVAVHPAAGTPTRQWGPRYFARLVDLLVRDHDVYVAIVGGSDDIEISRAIISQLRHSERVVSCVGRMELGEVFQLLSKCALFVGNNSGPSHIAALLGVPTVAIHSGVVTSEEWGPSGSMGVAVRRDMVCSPCYIANAEDCPRSLECLRGLEVGDVLKVCSRLLG